MKLSDVMKALTAKADLANADVNRLRFIIYMVGDVSIEEVTGKLADKLSASVDNEESLRADLTIMNTRIEMKEQEITRLHEENQKLRASIEGLVNEINFKSKSSTY